MKWLNKQSMGISSLSDNLLFWWSLFIDLRSFQNWWLFLFSTRLLILVYKYFDFLDFKSYLNRFLTVWYCCHKLLSCGFLCFTLESLLSCCLRLWQSLSNHMFGNCFLRGVFIFVKIKERKEDVLIISVNFYVATPTELQSKKWRRSI